MSDQGASPPPHASTARQMVGGLLMAAGVLIAGLCGLCTGYFQIGFLHDAWSGSSQGEPELRGLPTMLPLLIGTLPILFGVGLFMWGRWLLRTSTRRSSPPAPP